MLKRSHKFLFSEKVKILDLIRNKCYVKIAESYSKNEPSGRKQWLAPVIPALWEAREVDHLRSGVRDLPGQDGETPSLPKVHKLPRCSGGHL